MNTYPKVLIIGHGRLAQHLIHWCTLLHKQVLTWNRSQNLALLPQLVSQVDLVWLAISDSALISTYDMQIKPLIKSQKVVHFSGSIHHPEMISAHPLMTFSHTLYDLSTYEKIQFALTGAENLQQALPYFSNSFFILPPEHKELYHALCVATGNLSQIILSQALPLLADLKIPQEALQTYLKQSLQNYFELGANAVTGPIVRGDQITISKNLTALEKANPKLKKIYEAFL